MTLPEQKKMCQMCPKIRVISRLLGIKWFKFNLIEQRDTEIKSVSPSVAGTLI